MGQVRQHGIIEQYPCSEPIYETLCELDINGYSIMDSGLSCEQLDYFKNQLEIIYQKQVEEIGGVDKLAKISDCDIVRAPLGYDLRFLEGIWTDQMRHFLSTVFPHNFVLISQNGLLNRSAKDFYQIAYHRDLNFQHWTSTKPLALTILLCLDDFTAENGSTYVIPGSHKVTGFPTDSFVNKYEKQMLAKKGQYVIFDSMLFHRASENHSDKVRPALVQVVGEPFIGSQISIPKMLDKQGVAITDTSLAGFLGLKWGTCDSVTEWRQKRIFK